MTWTPFTKVKQRINSVVQSQNPWMLQWGRLLFWTALISIAWVVKHFHTATYTEDTYILLIIATAFFLAFLIMVVGTAVRTLRNLSLMTIFLGGSVLFGHAVLSRLGYVPVAEERQLDVTRTLFIVGGFAFVYSAVNVIKNWEWTTPHIIWSTIMLLLLLSVLSLALI